MGKTQTNTRPASPSETHTPLVAVELDETIGSVRKAQKVLKKKKRDKKVVAKKRRDVAPTPVVEEIPVVEQCSDTLKVAKAHVVTFRKEHGLLPTPRELAELMSCPKAEAAQALSELSKLASDRTKASNVRQQKLFQEHRVNATRAGIGDDSFSDTISQADATRMLTFMPPNPDRTSYVPVEFEQRLELQTAVYSAEAKREVRRNVTYLMKHLLAECVKTASNEQMRPTVRITPAVVLGLCRPYAKCMLFSSVHNTPPGLKELSLANCGFQRDLTEEEKNEYESKLTDHAAQAEDDQEKNAALYKQAMEDAVANKRNKRQRVSEQ